MGWTKEVQFPTGAWLD